MLVDANLLLHAKFVESPHHGASREWLERRLRGARPVGLPWASLLAFVRIGSNPRVYRDPLPVGEGVRQVRRWLSAPPVWVPMPGVDHAATLASIVDRVDDPTPKLVTDAHLAALAIEHRLTLFTADRGFGRFEALRWDNPLA